MQTSDRFGPAVLYAVFALSGLCGLIYESVWTHYLKLFLGHAAYAQTLVLCIFMGGMALGAWLGGSLLRRLARPILLYAAVELAVGLLAMVFHGAYLGITGFAIDKALPALGDGPAGTVLNWALGALLILPQSVLLGSTFPLLSAGLIRLRPAAPGRALAMLYFTNSLGAAAGALVSAFVLIARFGLPGTLLTAGLLNALVALLAFWVSRLLEQPERTPQEGRAFPAEAARGEGQSLQWVALLTGLSSFIYEIVWIRMLVLVLGSSTHAFELMLSAFILGLALGGWWVRRHIDSLGLPIRFLAWVQVAMGVLALATIPFYNMSFDAMRALMAALSKTSEGYVLYNLASHGLALAAMIPATFCAGMTLPLITAILLRGRLGEAAIGRVYGFNTLGAILGVLLTVHLGLPALGLKGTLVFGAMIDLGLGCWLMWTIRERVSQVDGLYPAAVAAVLATVLMTSAFGFDPLRMASGVYRTGAFYDPANTEVIFAKAGKTATVHVLETQERIIVQTNGKTDASIGRQAGSATADEATQILLAALPLAFLDQPAAVAVIGLGSGMSSATALLDERVRKLDSIEIESAMVDAARHFGPAVAPVFSDPRSAIHIEDAKTYFATRSSRYDLIISEPSNPWVSGVASLFTAEFYQRVRKSLAPQGVFAQWIQLYEIDLPLLASIFKGLGAAFPDYAVYTTNGNDLIVVARLDGPLGVPDPQLLGRPALGDSLKRVGIASGDDLASRKIGGKRLLQPLFDAYAVPLNSDYFPYLDQHAAEARFRGLSGSPLLDIPNHPLPLLELLDRPAGAVPPGGWTSRGGGLAEARQLVGLAVGTDMPSVPLAVAKDLAVFLAPQGDCRSTIDDATWLASALVVAGQVNRLSSQEAGQFWDHVKSAPCADGQGTQRREWLRLHEAAGRRDPVVLEEAANAVLGHGTVLSEALREYAISAGLLGALAEGGGARAEAWLARFGPALAGAPRTTPLALLRLHWALSAGRAGVTASGGK